MIYAQLLFLLLVANGAPIMARWVLGEKWNAPLDCGVRFVDGRPLLGPSKSFRGVICAVCGATLSALLLGLSWDVGFQIGLFAMIGDSCSSFIKRRWGMASGGKALGIDQVPESALPLLSVGCVVNVVLRCSTTRNSCILVPPAPRKTAPQSANGREEPP